MNVGIAVAAGLAGSADEPLDVESAVIDFNDRSFLREWTVVNDSVMGGVSRSRVDRTEEGNLLFEGTLSLANNGGFASARGRPNGLDFKGASSIAIDVRGDGRTYYLDLRLRGQSMGGSFRASFPTVENEWTRIAIPFSRFVRQAYGRYYQGSSVNPDRVDSIGFTLADKNPGAFRLEVRSVESLVVDSTDIRKSNRSSSLTETSPRADAIDVIQLAIARGAPLYNAGYSDACADIYEVACRALTAITELPESSVDLINTALGRIESNSDASARAWVLRHALDEVFARLNETDGRREDQV